MNGIEHIGIAVKKLSASIPLYEKLLGTTCYKTERVDSENVETAFFQTGSVKIELLESMDPSGVIARYIEKKGWYNYDGPANLITPLPGRVLVIRTAAGKYAKLEILNYYRKGQTPSPSDTDAIKMKNQRFYLFRYSYQGNGSAAF